MRIRPDLHRLFQHNRRQSRFNEGLELADRGHLIFSNGSAYTEVVAFNFAFWLSADQLCL